MQPNALRRHSRRPALSPPCSNTCTIPVARTSPAATRWSSLSRISPRIDPVPPVGNPPSSSSCSTALAADTGGAANIFRTLARHPGLLRRFLPWAGKLLAGGKLPADERELAILRVAVRCGSDYEWGQHVRIARDVGLDDVTIAAVRATRRVRAGRPTAWPCCEPSTNSSTSTASPMRRGPSWRRPTTTRSCSS